jgi:hypothetical protein
MLLELDLVCGPIGSKLRFVKVVVYIRLPLGLASTAVAEDTDTTGAGFILGLSSEESGLLRVKFGLKSTIFDFSNLIFLFLFSDLFKF